MLNKKKLGKRALSPIITTVLLVLLAIILASIIIFWAFGFIKEHITKFDSSTGEEKPIEDACSAVGLTVSNDGNQISLINTGNVPVNKVAIKVNSADGSSLREEQEINLIPGSSVVISSKDWNSGSTIQIIPILIGKTQNTGKYTEFTCSQVFSPTN